MEYDFLGKEESWGGKLDVYVNWPTGATQGVVIATDVFGWKRPLVRKLADKIAAEGFVAVVPDFFKGDPIKPYPYPTMEEALKWIESHPFESAAEDTLASITALKKNGIQSVGIAGFCYGGKIGAMLAKDSVTDAIVILHPGRVTNDEIKSVKTPFAILAAEFDDNCTLEQVEEYKTILESQKDVEFLVKVFKGQHHGWAIRYDESDKQSFTPAYEAQADTLSWFKKHLK